MNPSHLLRESSPPDGLCLIRYRPVLWDQDKPSWLARLVDWVHARKAKRA